MHRLCVFCGSTPGRDARFGAAADTVAAVLVEQQIELVYGGANVGLMGRLADGVLSRGGRVIGVIPKSLVEWEVAHTQLTHLHVVDTLAERKQIMADLSDGFIALPGGLGTLEEIFEMLTLTQLQHHTKPSGFLNVAGYYDRLFDFLGHALDSGFLRQDAHDTIYVDDSPAALLTQLRQSTPPSPRDSSV